MEIAKWYRVAGFGHKGGSACRSPEEAWESVFKGIPESEKESTKTRFNFILYAATTRKAANKACVSVMKGKFKNGFFWRSNN